MKYFCLLFVLISTSAISQIRGTVTDEQHNPLPFVSIFFENSYKGTTTNDSGNYELPVSDFGKYVVVFQYLGYKTKKVTVDVKSFPQIVDVVLSEENIGLNEVVINKKDNPANAIIRKAISARRENSEKTARYKADFYSRGIFRIKNAPKYVLGQKIDMFDEILDSTRTGILYLSETVSKLVYQKPDKMKETILASKVSGNDNGFSFNNAASVNFDFYDNYVEFNVNTISPISSNAFSYYKYQLEGSFFTDSRQEIYKIKVIPKRATEPCFAGYIYIVEGSWAIYAIDLSIKGDQMQQPAINTLWLKQNFSYNANNKLWVKNTQVIDFEAGMLGIKVNGRFTYVYSNFEFEEKFAKKTFTNEVLSFEKEANKKDDAFWNTIRPVPLTQEEVTDYDKKDKLQTKKKSQHYLDSVDAKKNKFKLMSTVSGYTYRNSFKNYSFSYDGILTAIGFNTVQGYNSSTGFSFTKRDPDKRTYTTVGTNMNYGISEDRFRATGYLTRKFNNTSNLSATLSGGSSIEQFNPAKPISRIVNSFATSFFRNNYMKLYDRNFIGLNVSDEIINGISLTANLEYNRRRPLFNNTNESILQNDKGYTSNNPLAPEDFLTAPFETHNLAKAMLMARFSFGQQYWSRPDGKFNIPNDNYPVLSVGFEKGFVGSEKHYEFGHLMARMTYDLDLGNKGILGMNLRGGKFFDAEGISFVDYRHFNGNRTHIGQSDRYLNTFNLLPYYTASTNDRYFEAHFEHNDNGYIINKIPLLNKLKATMVLGAANLAIPGRKPYNEFSIGLDNLGFGKFRIFRFDYVRSYQGGFLEDGVVFGLKFLNVLD
ncbi:MAG: carboxypeptidase-like regulatory domain-containing protein [Flavobacterium sp.]|nr:MAG: carboxypeptidase-like regulatory domain-containing protein [Flavobacterium sp.]